MGATPRLAKPHKTQICFTLCAILPIVFLRLYLQPISHSPSNSISVPSTALSAAGAPLSSPAIIVKSRRDFFECNLTQGRWVVDISAPLYSWKRCRTIKEGQNCILHGRPDRDYLHWRWKPNQCSLPRFKPANYLQLIRNRHVAFIGDSMARNQLESLLCMLATASSPKLVYRNGRDNKFRRWVFPSYNATVSVYWSPFLVKGVEKSDQGPDHNLLYLDSVNPRWSADLPRIDVAVLSIGHWFLHPAVYYDRNGIMGCHYCPGLNHTEIGFYPAARKALRTALRAIVETKAGGGEPVDVILTTFSPSHFEGEWDKVGACPRRKPYGEGEKVVDGVSLEMRRIVVEEAEAFTVGVLDITELSFLRPDGHPGPYMHPSPFHHGLKERVQNDCVHWCLPGPVDAWNEIMLDMMRRWRRNR